MTGAEGEINMNRNKTSGFKRRSMIEYGCESYKRSEQIIAMAAR